MPVGWRARDFQEGEQHFSKYYVYAEPSAFSFMFYSLSYKSYFEKLDRGFPVYLWGIAGRL